MIVRVLVCACVCVFMCVCVCMSVCLWPRVRSSTLFLSLFCLGEAGGLLVRGCSVVREPTDVNQWLGLYGHHACALGCRVWRLGCKAVFKLILHPTHTPHPTRLGPRPRSLLSVVKVSDGR